MRQLLWPEIDQETWNDPGWQWRNRLQGATGLDRISRFTAIPIHPESYQVIHSYPWAVTPYYLSLADPADPLDPILLQVLPAGKELAQRRLSRNAVPDPLQEQEHSPVPGLIHRYEDRCLILVSALCATLCRHCNRKRTWRRPEAALSSKQLEKALDYVADTPSIREVILSGGDPLAINRKRLDWLLSRLHSIAHVEVLRIGTRLPVTLPQAIDHRLCDMLSSHRPLWINTHFNHPREITPEATAACRRLQEVGLVVSNQAVLLKGVNDRPDTVMELCNRLQAIMVRPYYLFQCDMVEGTAHFRTKLSVGLDILRRMWCVTGGLSVPYFVVDLPEGRGKVVAAPASLLQYDREKGLALFETYTGEQVEYPDP